MRRDHEFTPEAFQHSAQGVIISVQVEDVRCYLRSGAEAGFSASHRNEESFGMRRFMVADPNGLLVNIFSFG